MWERLDLQVRWMFEEVQSLAPSGDPAKGDDDLAWLSADLKSIRGAYHARQKARGLCKSCPQPLSTESKTYCMKHLEMTRASARRSARKKRAAEPNSEEKT